MPYRLDWDGGTQFDRWIIDSSDEDPNGGDVFGSLAEAKAHILDLHTAHVRLLMEEIQRISEIREPDLRASASAAGRSKEGSTMSDLARLMVKGR